MKYSEACAQSVNTAGRWHGRKISKRSKGLTSILNHYEFSSKQKKMLFLAQGIGPIKEQRTRITLARPANNNTGIVPYS